MRLTNPPADPESWNPPIAFCEGKEGYTTKALALEVIQRRKRRAKNARNRKESRREVASLNTYQCKRCHRWHIGSGRR